MAKAKKTTESSDAPAADAIPQATASRLRKLIIQNFGCIGNSPVAVELDEIVVLVGPNTAGKSTILHAYKTITESSVPKLTLEDFHERTVDPEALPTVELITAVGDDLPGSQWVEKIDDENIVRERWVWNEAGVQAKRQGWDVTTKDWSDKVPWGAPNVANSRRPVPHRLEAFANPAEQIKEVTALLLNVLQDRIKGRPAEIIGENGKPQRTGYGKLLDALAETQTTVVEEAKTEIEAAERQLTSFVGSVFNGYEIKFDARPEDELAKGLNFFKAGTELQMGPKDGHLSSAERQGSGARRTLMWAALRYITESTKKSDAGSSHLLLLDEPELCLHPNAIREACATLYQLPETKKWQVMVTTHSPAFIDLSRDNTTVVRVERDIAGVVRGTTVFRPTRAKLDDDEKRELKLLNIYDPHVAEFFFGGRTILVEGDTEYTAFKYVMAQDAERELFKDVHIVRARGKVTIVLLAKILNQFSARYAVLHDSDLPTTAGGVWTNNERIRAEVFKAPDSSRVRLVSAVTNFESAIFGTEADKEKPYNAYQTLKLDNAAYGRVKELLLALIDFSKPLPQHCVQWSELSQLESAVSK